MAVGYRSLRSPPPFVYHKHKSPEKTNNDGYGIRTSGVTTENFTRSWDIGMRSRSAEILEKKLSNIEPEWLSN